MLRILTFEVDSMIDYNNIKQQLIKALYKGFSSSLMDMIKINTEPHGKYGKLTQVKHHVNPNKDQPVNHSKSGLDTPINGYSLLSNLITYGKSEVSQQDKTNYQLLEQLHEEKLKHIVQLLKSPAYNNYTKYYDAADAWRDLGGDEDFGEDTEYNHWERNLTDFPIYFGNTSGVKQTYLEPSTIYLYSKFLEFF